MPESVLGIDYLRGVLGTPADHTQCMTTIGSDIHQRAIGETNLYPAAGWTNATEPLSPLYCRVTFLQFARD